MSGADGPNGPVDEFDQIERLLRPLTDGAPEALGLLDDAAVLRPPPGMDLVVTKDALVAGVHVLADDPLDLVARKLLRVNLSDMAAMGAAPFAYFLSVAWPPGFGWPAREAFAAGLRQDQDAFGVRLHGGDTVSTPGPLTASLTLMGWTPHGGAVLRSGARAGDLVLVSGTIGDGALGLRAAQGRLADLSREDVAFLADRYRLPQPRLGLTPALRARASAAADVSDGFVADAGRIAIASGVAAVVDLDRLPLSPAARRWLDRQTDRAAALAELATGGDDYEIVCTAPPGDADRLMAEAEVPMTVVGRIEAGQGLRALYDGRPLALKETGWRHG